MEPLPDWLAAAEAQTDLTTENNYNLLAAALLSSGLVDGASCPGNGLNPDGSANACGMELAWESVYFWQNRFDAQILSAAGQNNLPPRVIKAVIAVESQFWPADTRDVFPVNQVSLSAGETGLGQMTTNGADLLLMWRDDYYQEVCLQAFAENGCENSYTSLDAVNRKLLQGLVLQQIDATCTDCPGGVDLQKADQAVRVLAETLTASCLQSSQLIYLVSGESPAASMSYEDFWRVVLANYHAGAGCVLQALRDSRGTYHWKNIADNFPYECASAAEYVRRIEEQIKP